jgi:hypothetical protein
MQVETAMYLVNRGYIDNEDLWRYCKNSLTIPETMTLADFIETVCEPLLKTAVIETHPELDHLYIFGTNPLARFRLILGNHLKTKEESE